MEGDKQSDHYKSIGVDIEWAEPNVSEHMKAAGIDGPLEHEICLWIKEELRLPKSDENSADWGGYEDLHPFWAIKRAKGGSDVNCEIRRQIVEVTTAMEWDELAKQGANISGLGGTMA